jgi:transcriptional regulator of acetoin/glycerol metabolism
MPNDLPSARHSRAPVGVDDSVDDGAVGLPSALVDLPYREAKQRALSSFDGAYFAALLRRTGGNISEAARQAGLDRSNFRRAAKRAGIAHSE